MFRIATTMMLSGAVFASDHASAAVDADAFMAEVLARYREARTYSQDTVHTFKIEFEGEMNGLTQAPPATRVSFRFERPGRFALRGGEFLDAYADGAKVIAHAPELGKYAFVESGPDASFKDLPGMFGMFVPQEFPIASIVLEGPGTFEESAFAVQSWGTLSEAEVEGRSGHRVSCVVGGGMPGAPGMEASIWVDSETGLIGRIEYDILEQTKAFTAEGMGGGPTPTVAKRVIEYRNVARNTPIDPDEIVFRPGENDEQVETFPTVQEIMAAAYGMDMGLEMEGGGGVEADAGLEVGTPAPAFSAQTLDGETVTLADLKGKVVLIDFWATWCGPCVRAMPTIQSLHEKFADKGLVVVGVSLDDRHAAEKLGSFVEDKGVTFAQIHDKEGAIAKAFGVSPIPHSVLVGKDGTVQANHIGFMPGMGGQYAEEIEKLLKGESLSDD